MTESQQLKGLLVCFILTADQRQGIPTTSSSCPLNLLAFPNSQGCPISRLTTGQYHRGPYSVGWTLHLVDVVPRPYFVGLYLLETMIPLAQTAEVAWTIRNN